MKRSRSKAHLAGRLTFGRSSVRFCSDTSWKCIICGFPNSNRRVRMGGHNVPIAGIRRRFRRSLTHLIDDYLPIATRWAIWDNRGLPAKRIATSATDDVNSVRRFDWLMRNNKKTTVADKQPAFVARAQRAFRRVARKVRTENRRLGLTPVVWPNGKLARNSTR